MKKILNLDLAYRIATCFGAGYLPAAPGTWGSLFALLVCLLIHRFPSLYVLAIVVLFAVGLESSKMVSEDSGLPDPSYIVIDEFVGMLLVFLFVPMRPLYAVLGFLLFRLVDVLKPAPIAELEKLKNGWGIMLDDVAAAVYANLILQIIKIL